MAQSIQVRKEVYLSRREKEMKAGTYITVDLWVESKGKEARKR